MNAREWIEVGAGLSIAVLLAGFMVVSAGMMGIPGHVTPSPPDPVPDIASGNNSVVLDTPLPASPGPVRTCRITGIQEFSYGSPATLMTRDRIPSTADAPGLAVQALDPYGGLPKDAVLERNEQVFLKKYNSATNTVEEQYPQYTRVAYRQYINNSPVMGSGLAVSLGRNGELLEISKRWFTYEYAGKVPVISPSGAVEKLNAGDLVERLQCSTAGMHVSSVRLGYYVAPSSLSDVSAGQVPVREFIPVWIFYATKPGTGEEPFPLMVNATRG